MKKEHEDYFSVKMHKLADSFNVLAEANKKVESTGDVFEKHMSLLQETYKEFKSSGYKRTDWDDLMDRSGAGKRMRLE